MAEDAFRRRYERERTARLQAEAIAERAIGDLHAANRALDARVAERTQELEVVLARLRAADEAKSIVLRGLAHEMSTPLHAVRGLVELVEEQATDAALVSAARTAGAAAGRLNRALRSLLELAAISGGDVVTRREAVVLGDHLDQVLERWRLPAARRGMLLVGEAAPDPAAQVDVDPVRLDQILDALVDNAIRFGRAQVRVGLERVEEPAPVLRIEVADRGPGIAADQRAWIFEPFRSGEGSGDGFGVGLALARAVAEALGGSLELAQSDVGARFVAELPVTPAPLTGS